MRASTLLKKLNAGDMDGAGEELLKWKYVRGMVMQGLHKRREVEQIVFKSAPSLMMGKS
jgi:lysozyme